MKTFDVCVFVVLLVFCGAVTCADLTEHDKTLKLPASTADVPLTIRDKQKPITFSIAPAPTTILLARPCTGSKTNEVSFVVNDGNGQPIVTINECTGEVTVAHPERMNQQAVAFWRTVQAAFPAVCAHKEPK